MAKKQINKISAEELEIVRTLAKYYKLHHETDRYGKEIVCEVGGKYNSFYWESSHSFENFLDYLKEFFEKEGEAKSFQEFKNRFKEFLKDEN